MQCFILWFIKHLYFLLWLVFVHSHASFHSLDHSFSTTLPICMYLHFQACMWLQRKDVCQWMCSKTTSVFGTWAWFEISSCRIMQWNWSCFQSDWCCSSKEIFKRLSPKYLSVWKNPGIFGLILVLVHKI